MYPGSRKHTLQHRPQPLDGPGLKASGLGTNVCPSPQTFTNLFMKLPECFLSESVPLVSGLQVCRAAVQGPLRTSQICILRAGPEQNGTIQSLGDTVPGTAVTQ